ncbi:MAG: putative ligase-like protein [Acidimicrobiaceae bacterium]|nr:putative ligase-like protein [Acidimicrobiaceae bacterium]
MTLAVRPPIAPMLAKLVANLPEEEGMFYEPKWDGFRCIVFRDGDHLELTSRNEKPLTRYFPELVEALKAELPDECVLDGEIVIVGKNGLDFDALSQRIHPAESRIKALAASTPSSYVAFDILALKDRSFLDVAYVERRALLEKTLSSARPPVHVTPATDGIDIARDWFLRFEGAGLDGIVAKPSGLRYLSDKRAMFKIKHERTADCVVGGFRWHKEGGIVGSLLLGLYDENMVLHHVGVTSSFSASRRRELVRELEPLREGANTNHPWLTGATPVSRVPGGTSRSSAGKDMAWEPLRPELVCEVSYDHLQEERFRHATTFRRWRPDRTATSCTYAQLESPVPSELSQVFGALGG